MADVTMVLAHRGASETHRENTLEAFAAARRQGADGIELDIRRSGDGVLVVHHDALFADGRAVSDTALSDFPDHVPTLADALDVSAGLFVNLELKNLPGDPDHDHAPAVVDEVVAMVIERALGESTLISSFDMASIDRTHAQAPDLATGWLVVEGGSADNMVERTVAHGHRAIHPHASLVDRKFVERAHGAGLQVMVWSVDDLDRAGQLIALGVDGIITNTPEPVRALLDAP